MGKKVQEKTKKKSSSTIQNIEGWLPETALDRIHDAEIVRRRIARAVLSPPVKDPLVGLWVLALVVGLLSTLGLQWASTQVAGAVSWLLETLTQVDGFAILVVLGVGCVAVATHKKPANQSVFRRYFFVALIRFLSDALIAAAGAFTGAAVGALALVLASFFGVACESAFLTLGPSVKGMAYYSFAAFVFGGLRLVCDSTLDSALTRRVRTSESGLLELAKRAGTLATALFLVLVMVTFIWA